MSEPDTIDAMGNTDVANNNGNDVNMEPVEATVERGKAPASTTGEPTETAGESTLHADIDPLSVERTWDHSNRKVIVYNINKFIKNKDLPKLQNDWLPKLEDPTSIKICKWKKPPNGTWLLATLETEEMVEPFLNLINANRFLNKKGQVLHAKPSDSKLEQELEGNKRGDDEKDDDNKRKPHDDDRGDTKRLKPNGPLADNDVRDKLTPLWKLSYEDQLTEKKRELIKRSCMKLVQEVKNKFKSLEKEAKRNNHRKAVKVYDWLKQKRAIEVEEIIPSPLQQEYRNKSEMTFGYRQESETTKVPAVGFMAAGWAGGVSKPHMLQNCPWEICAIVDIVDAFLATSQIPPYDSRVHRGLWRTLTIRSSKRTGEVMVVIIHAPATGGAGTDEKEDYSDIFAAERDRLVTMLTEKDLSPPERNFPDGATPLPISPTAVPLKVTSIFFQDYEGLSNPKPDHPVQHAFGKTSISEQLGECTFQISPGAFFQVNTECAEILYQQVVNKIQQVCPDPANTILFDVCCGTGTIGMTCMKAGVASTVIGVDISEPAIENARLNAKLNGFTSEQTRFVANRAELVMGQELSKVKHLKKAIVAVVDPARDCLHGDVIRALRGYEQIQRLIYVSCNPTGSLIKDTALLCAPPTKKYLGKAFRPTSAQPVDMFPMTSHCELVLTFDRLTDEEAGVEAKEVKSEACESELKEMPVVGNEVAIETTQEERASTEDTVAG